MSENEKTVYLLRLVNRYTAVAEIAKKMLIAITPDVASDPDRFDSAIRVKSRTTSTVDNNMLAVAYPDAYKRLFDEGKLLAKAVDIKNLGDAEVYENVVSTKKSTWLEYKDERIRIRP